MQKFNLFIAAAFFTAITAIGSLGHAQDKSFVIGFPQDNMANDWRKAQVMAVKAVLDQHPNVKFIYSDANGDTAKNVQDIEDMADQNIDLMIISPRDAKLMSPAITAVHAKGIPVVLLTRRIEGNGYTTFISADDAKIAASAARFMAEKMGEKGNILILQGVPTATTAMARTMGFIQEIERHPAITVSAIRPANYLRGEAIKMVEQALEQGLKFDAIYAQSDSMAVGARMALNAAGIDPKSKLIVGIDYIPEAREAIRDGTQAATFTYPTAGKEGAEIALKILAGETVARSIEVPSEIVTKDNVETIDTVF